jgi:peptide/nickel transport system substrate-binding protein
MNRRTRQIAAGVLVLTAAALTLAIVAPEARADAPAGQMTWAIHFTLAPTLFEPAETPGLITPFMFLYALHDAMVKPMPGKSMAPSLAESWSMSPDGLVYELVLRKA